MSFDVFNSYLMAIIYEGLVGTQYSWLSSIVYLAQLIWQPISSFLLVKLPIAKYCTYGSGDFFVFLNQFSIEVFVNVFMWGVVVASTAAAHNFSGLITARFFLGVFEASVGMSSYLRIFSCKSLRSLSALAPAFITITQMVCSQSTL